MKKLLGVCAGCALAAQAQASDINITDGVQSDFRGASKDVIATLEYKPLGPAAWSGYTGFEIAAIGAYVPTQHKQEWSNLTAGQVEVDQLALVGARVQKGLPLNLDIGVFYAGVPEYGVGIYGAELRYAILPGSVALPALAVRGAYDRLHGLDNFEAHATTLDAEISKGFAFLTPYLGAGYVWGTSEPKNLPSGLDLHKEDVREGKFYAGLRISLGLLHLTPEFERVGDNESYNLNFGIHW